jgi:FAD/FMN-containing dehydrogenase
MTGVDADRLRGGPSRAMRAHDASVASVPGPALRAFGERFHGRLILPTDRGYDEARSIWNGAIDRRPGLVARCADASDVRSAVRFAREHDLRMSVRSGGHGVGGLALCDDGLVVDLSALKGVRVEEGNRLAEVEAGVNLGELDRATQAFGLAVPAGIVTHTGVAGLTLGGGIGWLTRKHGLSVDNLVGADVVTADGELVAASEDDHPDLLWGLRGGGGNFGVVTSFHFRAHPIGPTVLAGPMLFPLERGPEVMETYRGWAAEAPE